MWKQIKLLTSLQFKNTLNFNEIKYSNDKKKRNQLIMIFVAFAILLVYVLGYIGLMSFLFVARGMGNVIPVFIASMITLVAFIFTIVKSSDMIFSLKDYEKTIVLPINPAAIVISRFLSVYIIDAVLSFAVMLPAALVYACFTTPGPMFYISILLGTVFIPLIPMTIAVALGSLGLAATSRMKHKKVFTTLLGLFFSVGIIVVVTAFSFRGGDISTQQIANMGSSFFITFGNYYFPANLFSMAAVNGNILALIGFLALSIALFALLVFFVEKNFRRICSSMVSQTAKRNFVMKKLNSNSVFKAIFIKDLKRYFSSSIYVMNTLIGYILVLVVAIALAFFGVDKLNAMFEGMVSITDAAIAAIIFCCVISPTTSICISIEGKQWWISNILPVNSKTIFNSKILVNLFVALPFYFISEIILLVTIKPDIFAALELILVPLIFIAFTAVLGLTVNIHSPSFDWENENEVVKQSISVLLTMAAGIPGIIVIMVSLFAFTGTAKIIAIGTTCLIFIAVGYFLYKKDCKKRLCEI